MNKNLVTKKQNTKMLAGLYLGWHLKTVRCKNVTLRAALFVRYKLQSRCNTPPTLLMTWSERVNINIIIFITIHL